MVPDRYHYKDNLFKKSYSLFLNYNPIIFIVQKRTFFPQYNIVFVWFSHLSSLSRTSINVLINNKGLGDFPGGPGAKTQHSQCRDPLFNLLSGKQIPHVTTNSSHDTTKESCMPQ